MIADKVAWLLCCSFFDVPVNSAPAILPRCQTVILVWSGLNWWGRIASDAYRFYLGTIGIHADIFFRRRRWQSSSGYYVAASGVGTGCRRIDVQVIYMRCAEVRIAWALLCSGRHMGWKGCYTKACCCMRNNLFRRPQSQCPSFTLVSVGNIRVTTSLCRSGRG